MRNDQWLLLYRRRTSGISIPRIQLSNRTAAEDETADFVIGTLSVANSEASWTFSITADPDSKFKIANDDELQLDDTLDYETAASHSVTIQADNGVDTPITRTFTISVTNVLEVTLAALSLDTDEIEENSAEDTVVGAVQDKSTGSTLTLIDDAGGRFKLSGTNIVAGATNIDYEAATSYEITLRETHADASNSPRDTVIEITVIDDADDTDTVPDAFEVGDWSIAAGDEEADVTISSLPADGGDTITDIEYRLDGGSWVSSGGTTSFTISGLTNDQEYDVELRAVNGVGAGAASDVKQVTPEGADEPTWTPLDPTTPAAIWLDPSDLSSMWKERTGASATTPAVVDDVVGTILNKGSLGGYAVAGTDAARPILRKSGDIYWLEFDGSDDLLALPVAGPLGANVTLAMAIRDLAGSHGNIRWFAGIGHVSGADNTSGNTMCLVTGWSTSNVNIGVMSASGAYATGTLLAHTLGSDEVWIATKASANYSNQLDNGTPGTQGSYTNQSIGSASSNPFKVGAANTGQTQTSYRLHGAVMAAVVWAGDDLDNLRTYLGAQQGRSL